MKREIKSEYQIKLEFKKNKKITNIKDISDSKFYKDYFRPSSEYKAGCMLIADEFKTYLDHIELKNDEFGKNIKYKHVLSKFDFNLDFNDSYFYYLAKNNNYTILTHDGDFKVKGVDVLTLNGSLLKA
ncbi:hypothetical protein [uncultured Mesonia sp.]|uniref:hypothetical protein n=1 Tax=uncultured Mesonia sp. TaxID=399731 RepID=UPI00374E56A2